MNHPQAIAKKAAELEPGDRFFTPATGVWRTVEYVGIDPRDPHRCIVFFQETNRAETCHSAHDVVVGFAEPTPSKKAKSDR